MATVTGHIALGVGLGRLVCVKGEAHIKRTLSLFALLAMLPDIDYLWSHRASPFFVATELHGAHTHSLVFALGIGALVGVLASGKVGRRVRFGLGSTAVLMSHIVLDLACKGRTYPLGVLWPAEDPSWVLDERWQFLEAARFDGTGLVSLMLYEALLFLPVLLWALWPRRGSVPDSPRSS